MRFIVLLLSMGSVVLFGYALAGMGGYLLGRGRIDYIVTGLLGGFTAAIAALILWRKYLDMKRSSLSVLSQSEICSTHKRNGVVFCQICPQL